MRLTVILILEEILEVYEVQEPTGISISIIN